MQQTSVCVQIIMRQLLNILNHLLKDYSFHASKTAYITYTFHVHNAHYFQLEVNKQQMRFQVLTVMGTTIVAFWDVMYSLVPVYHTINYTASHFTRS